MFQRTKEVISCHCVTIKNMYSAEGNKSPNASKINEEKSIPNLYRMELAKGYFNNEKENSATGSPLTSDSGHSSSEKPNEHDQSYNVWKSKNQTLNRSHVNSCTADMVSNLGRSLDQCQYVVPKIPTCYTNCTESELLTCNMQPVRSNQIPDMDISRGVNPKTFPDIFNRQRNYYQLEAHREPPVYFQHENNFHIPSNFSTDGIHQSHTLDNVCDTPPAGRHKFDSSQEKLHHFSHMKSHYSNDTLRPTMCGSFCRSANCNSHINPHLGPKGDNGCQGKDKFYFRHNQSSFLYRKENDKACSCSSTNTYKRNKSHKNDGYKSKHINDLYRIVYLQNQQLGLLQKQVEKLIELNLKDEKPSTNSQENATVLNKKYVKGTTEKRTFNLAVIKENENLEKKVSVGIMTSFVENNFAKISSNQELTASPRPTKNSDDDDDSSQSSSDEEPTTEHKTSHRRAGDANNISFTLNDVIVPVVEENIPSPQTSFHIEMQEYKSSSDTESNDSSENCDFPSPVGWTFYDTVVGKVNDMLKVSHDKKNDDSDEDDVRNATLDQLRQMGVSFVEPESPLTKRVTFNNRNNTRKLTARQQLQCDSETSLHMNALANKYLKNEQILPKTHGETEMQRHKLNGQNDLSHATLQYLERYQLSPNDNKKELVQLQENTKKKKKKKKKEIQKGNEKIQSRHYKSGKILDITAIKKQPKLLPKNA